MRRIHAKIFCVNDERDPLDLFDFIITQGGHQTVRALGAAEAHRKIMQERHLDLAIINLLPVPVLDGGHIVMALVERLFGRPLPRRLVEYTTTGFAVLLIGFMLYVSINDVKRYPVFRSMFSNQGVTIEKQQDSPAGGR